MRRAFQEFEIKDFRGGLVEMPMRQPNQSPDCRNVIARGLDLLEKRKGQKRLNLEELPASINGAHAYYHGETRLLVVASGGKAYKYDPQTQTFTQIYDKVSEANPLQFATCANYMVAFDGVNAPWKFDGTDVTPLANAPETGYLALLHREKLFTVDKQDESTLLWSDSFEPETWTVENYWSIGKGDGDSIKAICTYKRQNHLAVFKGRAIYALYGTSLDDFDMPAARSDKGAVGPNAVVESSNGIMYYISSDGIYAYNGLDSVKMTKALPVTWASVNQEGLFRACCWEWDGLLYFALPIGESTLNNFVLCFDPDTQAWWPYDGINASCFTTWEEKEGSGALPLTGSSADGYMVQQDTGTTDFGSAVEAYWTTDLLDLGYADTRKKLLRLITASYPSYDGANAVYVVFGASMDAASGLILADGYGDNLMRRFDFPNGSYCHYMQAKIAHYSKEALMKVRSLKFHFKAQERGA